METFIIDWIIEGRFEVKAENREAAEEIFHRISNRALAEKGTRSSDDARTPEEMREGIDYITGGMP